MFNYSFKPKLERKLQLFADYGFSYIHWCDDWNSDVFYTKRDIKEYRQFLDSYGLQCIDVHGTATRLFRIDAEDKDLLNQYIRLLKNRIEFCAALGGDAVVIHPPNEKTGSDKWSRSLQRFLQVFTCVKPLCEDLEITLAVENCFPTDEKILKFYFARYPPEFVGFCFDSGHANCNRNFELLFPFAERLKALHLHDNKGIKKNAGFLEKLQCDAHQPPLWGTIDWKRVMGWIKERKYSKPMNFEITHRIKLFDGTMEDFLSYTVLSINKLIQEY